MNLPRVAALDLRDPMVIENERYGWTGDFPAVPAKLRKKLYPKPCTIKVIIPADSTALVAALARAQANIERLFLFGSANPWKPSRIYRPIWRWAWWRIIMAFMSLAALLATIGIVAWAWQR